MFRHRPLRFVAGLVAFSVLAVPAFAATSAFGDPISDKRAEAEKVADRLETLQEDAEILAEQYNDARLALAEVEAKVAAAKARVADTSASARQAQGRRRRTTRSTRTCVGDSGGSAAEMLDAEDGNEVGRRKGYASAAIGDREDLLDRLRVAKAQAQADTTALGKAQEAAADGEGRGRREAQGRPGRRRRAAADRRPGRGRALPAGRRRAAPPCRGGRPEGRARPPAAPPPRPRRTRSSTSRPRHRSTHRRTRRPRRDPVADPPVGQGAEAAIAAARSVLGVRYTWGGADPSTGFDCSGLVMWAWAHGGKSLPHSSAAMYGSSRRISMSSIQPGDLIFYGSPVHHVALVHRRWPDHPRPAHRLLRAGRERLLLERRRRSRTGLVGPRRPLVRCAPDRRADRRLQRQR